MNIPEFSVRHSVTVLMMILIIVVLGAISLSRLTIELIPDLSYPVATVVIGYEGVASEDIETLVTKPVEGAVSKVKNVKTVNSTSQEGVSMVMVEFEWGTNIDFAAQDMRDQIDLIEEFLPEDIDHPVVIKFDPAMMPAIAYGITGERDLRSLRTLVKDDIKDRLERVEGIASAMLMGGLEREIQVRINRHKLEAYNLSLDQVVRILRYENLNLSGGHITEAYTEYILRSMGEYKNLDEMRNTAIAVRGGTPIYLRDIAQVSDTYKEIRSCGRTNRKGSVILLLLKESGANTVQAVEGVKREVERLKRELPRDIEFTPVLDQERLTKLAVSNTGQAALWGGLIAILVVFLFLRNWRPTITVGLAIPISIMATFIPIYFIGYSLNIITLGGLALGVGMLLSNAIIVIENIFRYLEEGKTRADAAIGGTSEVGMAITASTLTTLAVFLPLLYTTGVAGRLVRGLALTVSFSLFASLFVALTIVPMMASKIFKKRERKEEYEAHFGERYFERFKYWYKKFLVWALRYRGKTILIVGMVFILSMLLTLFIGKEFMSSMDHGLCITRLEMPVGTSLEETDRVAGGIEEIILKESEVEAAAAFVGLSEESKLAGAFGFGMAGVNEAQIMGKLKEKKYRSRSTKEIEDSIRVRLPKIEGAKIEFIDLAKRMLNPGASKTPVDIKVFGKDLVILKRISDEIAEGIKDIEGVCDVDTTLRRGKPELQIRLDREKAARLGITAGMLASTVETAAKGKVATQFRTGGDEFDIRVKFREEDRRTRKDIENIVITSPLGRQFYLRQIAHISKGKGPVQLFRENQTRKVSVTANVSGRDLGSIMNDIRTKVSQLSLPQGYFIEYGGEYERMRETFISLGGVFILAILLVYMIMAAQFESLVHPFTVIFTVPLALIGVVWGLFIAGYTLSLASLIGIIILVGVVVNNGIVLVDYVNKLRERGLNKEEALIRGATTKLRAIVLATSTAILGMVPMFLSRAEGSEMRSPMALSVIGGLLVSTILLLIVVPVLYSLFDDWAHRGRKKAAMMLHGEE